MTRDKGSLEKGGLDVSWCKIALRMLDWRLIAPVESRAEHMDLRA